MHAVRGARTKAARDIGLTGVIEHWVGGCKVQESMPLYALWQAYVDIHGRLLEVCCTVLVPTPHAAVSVAVCNTLGSKEKGASSTGDVVKRVLQRAFGCGQVQTAPCVVRLVVLVR